MIYLKTILDKSDDEVVKRVYLAMKENPMKNDWYLLLKSDFDKMNIVLDEKEVENSNVLTYKQSIKTSVWNAFSKKLSEKQKTHTLNMIKKENLKNIFLIQNLIMKW